MKCLFFSSTFINSHPLSSSLIHYHQLSSTFINSHRLWACSNFDESLCAFDQSWTSMTGELSTWSLVWLAHESWRNSRANFHFLTLANSHPRLTGACELTELSCADSRFSTLFNSHPRLIRLISHRIWEISTLSRKDIEIIDSTQKNACFEKWLYIEIKNHIWFKLFIHCEK